MPSSTPVSTADNAVAATAPALAETCARIVREKIPNFFRLYLNPFVVQTCYCLAESVRATWPATQQGAPWPSFLANSFDEAVSGGIKLVRYCANRAGQSAAGLVYDPANRLGPFAQVTTVAGARIEFVPDLTVVADVAALAAALRGPKSYGFIVLLAAPSADPEPIWEQVRAWKTEANAFVVVAVDRAGLAAWRGHTLAPDVVVFDESFADNAVPFAAFTARPTLYQHWTRRGKSTFHSTTFQPNAIASLHFLRSLERADPHFHATVAPVLRRIAVDPAYCREWLAKLYSPFLARAIRTLGFDTLTARAEGHYIVAGDRRIFDCVAGVACSVRGHNPDAYVAELVTRENKDADDFAELTARLEELTGLGHLLPAVSGAGAVENALRVALVAQHPRRVVVAFKGGFGGKTLFALTGTARASYKEHLDPLYRAVGYVDPNAPDVLDELGRVFAAHAVAVVQLELVQAVGGVRALPPSVLHYLQEHRDKHGYLLLVDEVQTGLFRTGPFTLSERLGVQPDLLTVGKGTSDMMFPFALTLYSNAVHERLRRAQPELADAIRARFDYPWGYRTVLSVLDHATATQLPQRVEDSADLFARLLTEGLAGCRAVREVRTFGLLIAIELETRAWPQRWFPRGVSWLYLVSLLRHSFPLLVGFCQYEPQVLKLTPPLSITAPEIRAVCDALVAVLKTPPHRLVASAAWAQVKSFFRRPSRKESPSSPAGE